eukprot:GEMP01063687.1.p1 GENE.GEMP01063687.1~~GEMP01063687.1.p1  ORF type:complete len:364 (+),score=63.04 GEMP01063687.1:108-1199(+)
MRSRLVRLTAATTTRTSVPVAPPRPTWWQRQPGTITSEDPRVVRLSKEMEDFAADQLPDPQYVKDKDRFLESLQKMASQVIAKATVSPFGSVVNGFWTPSSDLDVCIQVPGASTRANQIKLLRQIAAELQRASTHYIEPRFGAKVPIIHWAPKQAGMMACDISINNTLAIVNSRLIGHYTLIDPRLRTVGIAIKHWAAQRGINDRSVGTLSSFSLVLMLIHLFQRRRIPIVPSLQDVAIQRNHAPLFVNGVDCRFSSEKSEVDEELEYLRKGSPPNDENAGFLLHEFFRYYGFDYKQGVIAIRDRQSFVPHQEENTYLYVDNPFEIGKDVANVEVTQYARIRQEFRRAHGLIAQVILSSARTL